MVGAASGWLARTRKILEGPAGLGARRISVLSEVLPPDKVAVWEREGKSLEAAAVYVWYHTLSGTPPRDVPGAKVGARFFEILGSSPARGRLFRASDVDRCRDCAVVSYDYWRQDLDGDPQVVGRSVAVDGRTARVIGVLPRDFWFPESEAAVWTLYIPGETWREWPVPLTGAICRLRGGINAASAQSELRGISGDTRVTVTPMARALVRPFAAFLSVFAAFFCLAAVCSFTGSARRAAFGISTAALALATLFLAALEFSDSRQPLAIWGLLVASTVVVYGCVRDQRMRCRVCLCRLIMPVRIGHAGQVLLDPAGTELVCPHGHGMLYTPEMPAEPECWVRVS
jgi:hypothetical protein